MSSTSTERMRLKRQRDREDPDRKFRKLDSIYMFGEIDVSVIIDDDNNIWFKGVDLARALEMEDPNNSIYNVLDKKYCKSYEILSSLSTGYCHIPNIHPKTTFVNETGMNMYVLRSRKPKAEEFAEWVCGEVLPSIRKTNKYEIEPENNPYRELNDYLKIQIDELQKCVVEKDNRIVELHKSVEQRDNQIGELYKRMDQKDNQNVELHTDIRKYVGTLFEMKKTCVPTLKNEAKKEYFVVFRKYKTDTVPPSHDLMPYYACRVQLDSLEQTHKKLLKQYPELEKLLQLLVPNSVTFFNYIFEELPQFFERGVDDKKQSFQIKNINEAQMLQTLKNIHNMLHGDLKDE